ncbi:helix-turn-helix transcriptional regulator [Mangrovitalea sediminis]|uniref:helix-turn-helix transcriptional regulator n=1 Tax=Mangrovitalea sediminis TaxID=1982043 RepID=UPI000BE4E6AA|nr:WYL domain-containing protein [Mangrovitalea sediminis]
MSIKEDAWDIQSKFHLIEVVAYWEGRVTNNHLKQAFGISSRTTGSQIFKQYNVDTGNNLNYSAQLKGYIPSATFSFRFSQGDLGEYLSLMTQHKTLNPSFAGLHDLPAPTEAVSIPHRAVSTDVVRQVVQATQCHGRLEIVYRSHSNPEGEDRIIAPHTLVYSGLRWHARAWCEKHRDFRDFVLTRIAPDAEFVDDALPEANPTLDARWHQYVDLILTPNPKLTLGQQKMVALDYGMGSTNTLRIKVRQALAHYLMLSMNIFLDETRFKPEEHPLIVTNKDEIAPFIFG